MSRSGRAAVVALWAAVLSTSCGDTVDPSSHESVGPAWEAARTSADGTSVVVVFTGGQEYDPSNPCTLDYRAEVVETTDSVTVGLIAIRPPSPDGEVECTAAGFPRRLEVALAEPLGRRSVIEANSRVARQVFDGSQLLEPDWLPEGWSLRGEGVAYPLADPSQAWIRGWGAPGDDPFTCVPSFSVVQGTPAAVRQLPEVMGGGPEIGSYDIDGSTAVHTRNAERFLDRLTWTTGDLAVAVLATTCSPEPVDLDALLTFARSLGHEQISDR